MRKRAHSRSEPRAPKTRLAAVYLVILALAAALINERVVQWSLAVRVGGYTLGDGFKDAFEYFTLGGYLFMTAFRLVPYVVLGSVVVVLSRSRWNDFVHPIFAGGVVGIIATIVWGLWTAQHAYYTEEHVSSTTAIAFLFIPLYAVVTGGVGSLLLACIYLPFRRLLK